MDYLKKIKQLAALRNRVQFTHFESHPYNALAKTNKSGFIESILWRIDNGHDVTQAQIGVIDKMYDKYFPQNREENTDQTPAETSWNNNGVTISAEGGFVKIDGDPIDPPVDRKDAVRIAKWLNDAWQQLSSYISNKILDKEEQGIPAGADDFPPDDDNQPEF